MSVNANIKIKVFNRDKYSCVECGAHEDLTIDHVIPLSKGGSDTMANLQTMCMKCNMEKGNRYGTFLQKLFKWTSERDLESVRSELLSMMSVKSSNTKHEIQQSMDKRLGDIEPKIKIYIENLLKSNPLTETGIKNSVEGYGKRSLERDNKLLGIVYLLADEVEQLRETLRAKEE